MRTVAENSGPVIFPRMVQGAILTCGLLRMRLHFAQFAVGHEVELVVVFGKPDGRVDGDASLSEGREADVTLAVDFSGDGHAMRIL